MHHDVTCAVHVSGLRALEEQDVVMLFTRPSPSARQLRLTPGGPKLTHVSLWQAKIRPPRWESAGEGGVRRLPAGGSRSARCVLCPVRHGAFRETVDTREWVHEARRA